MIKPVVQGEKLRGDAKTARIPVKVIQQEKDQVLRKPAWIRAKFPGSKQVLDRSSRILTIMHVPDIRVLEKILIDAAQKHLPGSAEAPEFEQKAKPDGSVVTEVDANLQNYIHAALKADWPQVPLLGEEMGHEEQQELLAYSEQGLWILDRSSSILRQFLPSTSCAILAKSQLSSIARSANA